MELIQVIILLLTAIIGIVIGIIVYYYISTLKQKNALSDNNVVIKSNTSQPIAKPLVAEVKAEKVEVKKEKVVEKGEHFVKESPKIADTGKIPQRLTEWIVRAREHGYDDQKIEGLLSSFEWDKALVSRALRETK